MRQFLITGLIFIGRVGLAQQMPLTNLYTDNKYLLTSAYQGSGTGIEASLNYRTQWVRFKGSPNTAFLTGLYDVGRNLTAGIKLSRDESNVLNTTHTLGTCSYHLKLGLANSLYFSLGMGFYYNSLDVEKVVATNPNDPLLSGAFNNKWNFANEASAYWKFRNLETALTIPGLISNYRKSYTDVREDFINQRLMMLMYAGYPIPYDKDLEFIPSVLLKHVPKYTTQYELSIGGHYQDRLSLGIGYRQRAGIIGRLGIDPNEKVHIAYAYEFFSAGIASYSGGSHEIQITTRLNKNTGISKSKQPFRDLFKFKKKQRRPSYRKSYRKRRTVRRSPKAK
jgi:type IX secretion system PorP/SprF family membrane protein